MSSLSSPIALPLRKIVKDLLCNEKNKKNFFFFWRGYLGKPEYGLTPAISSVAVGKHRTTTLEPKLTKCYVQSFLRCLTVRNALQVEISYTHGFILTTNILVHDFQAQDLVKSVKQQEVCFGPFRVGGVFLDAGTT